MTDLAELVEEEARKLHYEMGHGTFDELSKPRKTHYRDLARSKLIREGRYGQNPLL